MKVYVRKIDEQCITHQISLKSIVFKEFFNEIMEFTATGVTSGYSEKVGILTATDLRFDAGLKHVISKEGNLEVGDILVLYKDYTKYELELIKPTNPKYRFVQELCERDERHTLLDIESPIIKDIDRKEEYKNWLINSRKYADETIKNYVNYITYIYEKGLSEKNLYTTKNITYLDELLLKFKSKEEYIEYNNRNNRIPYCALVQYRAFIADTNDYKIDDTDRLTGGYNKIYYGIPGSGKSYIVNEKFNEDEYIVFRTTFHPEYTNSDFVGQIIPIVKDNKVKYEFRLGPFTLALKYALENKNKKVCLIIEEINRGNASAIFGDIFQLLDRTEYGKSKYAIYNGPIIDYFAENNISMEKIYVPSNMWIIATMNTSDQNVFTLDTAFKRRWKMEYIKNIFADNERSKELRNKIIPLGDKYPNVTWEKFVKKINKHIISDTSGINGEDKQLGMYFVSIEEINDPKEFAEKILSYLWEDVAKLNTSYWFGNIASFDELIEAYNKNTLDVFNSLFDDEIKITDEISIKSVGE